jgi:hypothetical protein
MSSHAKIKIEEDPYRDQHLLSRTVLTRGFNAYDDDNVTSSMIDESDLLDLESIDTASGMNSFGKNANAHAMAAASIGFSAATPTHGSGSLGNNKYGSLRYGTTPPVPESTSPFDSFLLNQGAHLLKQQNRSPNGLRTAHNANNNIVGNNTDRTGNLNTSTNNQNSNAASTTNMSSSYSSPRPDPYAQRFLNENAVASTSSTPVGSYEYSLSPSHKPKLSSSHPDDKQQLILAERRRRRRESHNAVERRRRDNINEKIKELCDLLPEQFLMAALDIQGNPIVKDERPNKGTILSRSVDYIKQLQVVIDEQNRREVELQEMVRSLEQQLGRPPTEFGHTSAEYSLSKAGIGPHIPGATPEGMTVGATGNSVTSPGSQDSAPPPNPKNNSGMTPENFTPEFDLDYYNSYNYGRHENALVDEDFGLSPQQ